MPASSDPQVFQRQFHQRWNHLHDPHVRTLAWLLDAPDLLDSHALPWQGRIATLGPLDEKTETWLNALDQSPGALHAHLDKRPATRLGRYAEKLMAFYLQHRGVLYAHGVQVRAGKGDTIGEFDFLLRCDDTLTHWEFATKLYLLKSSTHSHHLDYFVGPNLADSLGAKMRKIMDQQLSLSRHPAALLHLPQPVATAQALVKGWLFYQGKVPLPIQPCGISHAHCHGFWCSLEELDRLDGEHYMALPRLSWLAPVKVGGTQVLSKTELKNQLYTHFNNSYAPVLVAILEQHDESMLEVNRGFVVPGNWPMRVESGILNSL